MQLFSIKRTVVTLGAVAALAVGTGIVPSMTGHGASAQAAERVGSTVDAVHKALSRIRMKLEACIQRRLRLAGEYS